MVISTAQGPPGLMGSVSFLPGRIAAPTLVT